MKGGTYQYNKVISNHATHIQVIVIVDHTYLNHLKVHDFVRTAVQQSVRTKFGGEA